MVLILGDEVWGSFFDWHCEVLC